MKKEHVWYIKRYLKSIWLYIVFTVILLFQIYKLFVTGPYQYALHTETARKMILELLIFSTVAIIVNWNVKGKLKFYIGVLLIVLEAYLHQVILPFLAATGYFGMIVLTGAFLLFVFFRRTDMENSIFWTGSLILGLDFVCLCAGTLSLCRIYSVRNMWIVLSAVSLCGLVVSGNRVLQIKNLIVINRYADHGISIKLFLSVVEASLLIQIGRAGLQGDYDALWYGIRSPYVLANSGKGIYENLHLAGFTYLYPKGFETILLPFSECGAWSCQFLFCALLVCATAAICWLFAKDLTNKKIACMIGALVITLPSLVNMGMTVKPDVITVFLQITAVYLIYLSSKRKDNWLVYLGLASLISSYCFKITAVLFTTVLLVGLLPFIRIRKVRGGITVLLFSLLTLGVIWGRTFVLTGSPLIAFLSPVLDMFDVEVKYPYAVVGGINQSLGGVTDTIKKTVFNLYGYFINPAAEGFEHVVIAWGTVLPLLLFLSASIMLAILKIRVHNCWKWVWLMTALCFSMLFGMGFISQADGNYFLLFYVAVILLAGCFIFKYGVAMSGICWMAVIFQICMIAFSNWSWSVGFSEIKVPNKGYINQQLAYDNILENTVGKEICEILNRSKKKKAVAVTTDVTQLAGMKCVAERFCDIESGNPALIDEKEHFLEYCKKCGIDFVYVDDQEILPDDGKEQLLIELIKTGAVQRIIFGENATLLILAQEHVQADYFGQLVEQFMIRRGKVIKSDGWYEDGWTGPEVEFYVYSKTGKVMLDCYIPYKLDRTLSMDILADDVLQGTDVRLETGTSQIAMNVPQGKYVKVNLLNHFSTDFPGDLRQVCYVLEVEEE